MKLREQQNIKGFDELAKKLGKLKEQADFCILSSPCLPLPYTMRDDSSLLKYIWNWSNDQEACFQPTWRNFFRILREPGMDLGHLANQIEKYLASTSKFLPTIEIKSESSWSVLCVLHREIHDYLLVV